MSWIAAGVMVVGTIVNANEQSKASNRAASRQIQANTYEGTLEKALKGQEAESILAQSKLEADKILTSAKHMRGAQAAQSAGSGVIAGEGSSQIMQDRTTELAMEDALAALYNGARGSSSTNLAGDFALTTSQRSSSAAADQNASNQRGIGVSAATSILGTVAGGYAKSQAARSK